MEQVQPSESSLSSFYPLVCRLLSGLIITDHTKGFQLIISLELLNNPEVRKDYDHHFKMRKYQLREVKLLVQVPTASKRRQTPKPSRIRISSPSPALSLVERNVRDMDEMKPK